MERGIRLIGNGQAPVQKYWEELLEMIRSGDLDPLQMVSHRCRIEDMETVYENPYIFMTTKPITAVPDLMPLLNVVMKEPRPLVILAEKVDALSRGEVPRADVAAVLAEVLTTDGTIGTTFDLLAGHQTIEAALAGL